MTQKDKIQWMADEMAKLTEHAQNIRETLSEFNDCEGCIVAHEQGENSLCGHCSRSFNDMWRTE